MSNGCIMTFDLLCMFQVYITYFKVIHYPYELAISLTIRQQLRTFPAQPSGCSPLSSGIFLRQYFLPSHTYKCEALFFNTPFQAVICGLWQLTNQAVTGGGAPEESHAAIQASTAL